LYTRWPKPISLKPLFFSLAIATYFFTSPPPSLSIAISISSTSWLAPPCSGPQRAQMPALIDANRFALLEPTIRTVLVEQFCSWSACRIRSRFIAFTSSGSISYSSAGTENIMLRKFSQ
jgi:hypothetical protein